MYRAKITVESMLESSAFAEGRRLEVFPSDTWSEAVEEGHAITFYSNDAAACEAINTRIDAMHRYPYMEWTPQRGTDFQGWEKVGNA